MEARVKANLLSPWCLEHAVDRIRASGHERRINRPDSADGGMEMNFWKSSEDDARRRQGQEWRSGIVMLALCLTLLGCGQGGYYGGGPDIDGPPPAVYRIPGLVGQINAPGAGGPALVAPEGAVGIMSGKAV